MRPRLFEEQEARIEVSHKKLLSIVDKNKDTSKRLQKLAEGIADRPLRKRSSEDGAP